MSTDITVESAIEELYGVFAPYRGSSMDDYCSHCVNEAEYERLVEPDRRDVSDEAIHHYAMNAIHTWGDVKGFKRFLPRMYELLAFDPDNIFNCQLWLPIGLLRHGEWREWPAREREAVEQYLEALWIHKLEEAPSSFQDMPYWDLDRILEAISGVTPDITPFLDAWQDRLDRPGLTLLLAIYLMNERETLLEADEYDADSSSIGWTETTWSRMRAWLRRPELIEALEGHFVDEDDPATSYRLGLGIELLEEFQGRRQPD